MTLSSSLNTLLFNYLLSKIILYQLHKNLRELENAIKITPKVMWSSQLVGEGAMVGPDMVGSYHSHSDILCEVLLSCTVKSATSLLETKKEFYYKKRERKSAYTPPAQKKN